MADGRLTRGEYMGGADASWNGNDVHEGEMGDKIGYLLGSEVRSMSGFVGRVGGGTIYRGQSTPVACYRNGQIKPWAGGAAIATYDGEGQMAGAAALLLGIV